MYHRGMRFSLRNYLLAVPCFGLAMVAIVNRIQYAMAEQAARSHGSFICRPAPSVVSCVFAVITGLAVLGGMYRLAATAGALGVFLAAVEI